MAAVLMTKQLTEDTKVGDLNHLIEWIEGTELELVEDVATKRLFMRGEFARAGIPTENKRVYPKALWEREIKRLLPRLAERKCYGELDHPEDGKTKLSRASHLITKLEVRDDVVYGEAQILGTAAGKDLAAILREGGKVGISSRGYGTTKPNEFGENVVQEDYKLIAFDFVADPADQTAYPTMVGESVDLDSMLLFEGIEFPEGDEFLPEENASGDPDMNAEIATDILTRMSELRTVVEADVRAELRSDETLQKVEAFHVIREALAPFMRSGEAREALERRDEEIARLRESRDKVRARVAELEEENEKLVTLAQVAGFAWYMERELHQNPDAERVRQLVGDLSRFESEADFQSKLASVQEHLEELRLEEEQAQEQHRELTERAEAQFEQLHDRVRDLETALHKSAEALHITGLQLYGERRIGKHPRAKQIREVFDRSALSSREDVDSIIEQFRPPKRSLEAIESTVSRIRRQLGGGVGHTPFDEEEPWPDTPVRRALSEDTDFNGLGVGLGALKELMPPGAD